MIDFLHSLLYWWTRRPRLVRAGCGHWLWYNDIGTPMYCGWECEQKHDTETETECHER